MYLMYPVAYPTAQLLDYWLGESHGTVYRKAGKLDLFGHRNRKRDQNRGRFDIFFVILFYFYFILNYLIESSRFFFLFSTSRAQNTRLTPSSPWPHGRGCPHWRWGDNYRCCAGPARQTHFCCYDSNGGCFYAFERSRVGREDCGCGKFWRFSVWCWPARAWSSKIHVHFLDWISGLWNVVTLFIPLLS